MSYKNEKPLYYSLIKPYFRALNFLFMLIGQDFEFVKFKLFGLTLQEPNGFIGNSIIFLTALTVLYLLSKQPKTPFLTKWKRAIWAFGLSFFVGGFGHLFFGYFSHFGKVPSWYLSLFIPFFIELAMISIYPNEKWKRIFTSISMVKMIFIVLLTTYLVFTADLNADPQIVLKFTTLHTMSGLIFALVFLAIKYAQIYSKSFYYFVWSVVVLLPTPFIQTMKINLHLYFDRNDLSHLLLAISLLFYYFGIKSNSKLGKFRNSTFETR